VPQPLSQRKSHGAHAKRPKARGKPSQIQSNNAPSALFDGIGLGAVGVAFLLWIKGGWLPHCSAKRKDKPQQAQPPSFTLFIFFGWVELFF